MSQRPGEASNGWLAGAGLLMAAPALYFVTANVLKYELGAAPGLEVAPIHPAILIGGLALAMTVNLWPILRVGIRRTEGELTVAVSVRTRPWNLVIVALAAATLGALLAYAVVENLG